MSFYAASVLSIMNINPVACPNLWSRFSGGCCEGSVQSLWHTPVVPRPASMSRVWRGFVSLARLPQSLAESVADRIPRWPRPQQWYGIMTHEPWKKEKLAEVQAECFTGLFMYLVWYEPKETQNGCGWGKHKSHNKEVVSSDAEWNLKRCFR